MCFWLSTLTMKDGTLTICLPTLGMQDITVNMTLEQITHILADVWCEA